MRTENPIILVLSFAILFVASLQVRAQYAYGVSDIVYDPSTKTVASFSGTALDYWAGLHYDPAVVGGIFERGRLLGYASSTGISSFFNAVVRLRTTYPAPPDTRYDVLSDHYIAAYFYTTIVILDDGGNPIPARRWYDPLGFSAFGGGAEPSWSSYRGSPSRETFYEVQYFKLGSTGKGVIANPTSCSELTGSSSGLAPCQTPSPTPTPTPPKVEIRNRFKPNEDLGATNNVYQALVGAPVQLNAIVEADTNSEITYRWSSDASIGDMCNTKSICLAFFNSPNSESSSNTYYTINLEVRQGNQPPVLKSVKIKVSLPAVTYSGTERPPIVTTLSNPCSVGNLTGLQNLILGCPVLPRNRDSPNKDGFYARAVVVPPSGFISDGSTSYVEFRQIIKPNIKRYGRDFSECFEFNTGSQDGWREDFNGREADIYNEYLLAGFKLRDRFKNEAVGTNANVSLEFLDSPGSSLANVNATTRNLNRFFRNDQFETYVTYFAGLEEDDNLGESYRHALAVMPWKWLGSAEKRSSGWQLYGAKYPQQVIQLPAQSKDFSLNSTGERAFNGKLRADSGNLDGEWKVCSSQPPVTIRTKRNIAVWRNTNGIWYIVGSDGSIQAGTSWGVGADIPVPGDYDGDGRADFAIFRPGTYDWYILNSSDGSWTVRTWGQAGDIPAPGDFDGDGRTDMTIFRPATGEWFIIRSNDNSFDSTQFGQNGDLPVPSDYDGDGIDDFAVWTPTAAIWSIRKTSDSSTTNQTWGLPSDKPVIGDYDGDGKTDIAVWQSDGNWHILLSSDGTSRDMVWGNPATDKAVAGDYDGDDKTDLAVWRPNGSEPAKWYIIDSSTGTIDIREWGAEGDIPAPAAYNR